MNLTNRVALIEVIWTVGCLPGLYFNIHIARRAIEDLAILRRQKINSIREYSAVTSVVLFAYLATIQFAFVLVGILAMVSLNSPRSGTASFATTGIFLLLSFLSSGIGFIVDKRRRFLRDALALENDDDYDKDQGGNDG
jgi:uncharacterized oligopeptide transporter (OPT) family protein